MVSLVPFVLALFACDTTPAPPPEPEKPACDLGLDKLDGKSFVRETQKGSEFEQDTWARAQFFTEGDKVKVKYNTRALTDMYTYSCEKKGKELYCLADNVDLYQWCQTLVANKGACTPAGLAEATGQPMDKVNEAKDRLDKDMKGLDADGLARMKAAYSQPNNQLRGVLHVKYSDKDCKLTLMDRYLTMVDGEMSEHENFVGTSKFAQTDKELVFEHCKDTIDLVANAAPDGKPAQGENKLAWKVGETVNYLWAGPDMTKPETGCTYTADTWVAYELDQKGRAVNARADGTLDWGFTHTYDKAGKYVTHLYRYKDCGQGPALVDVACQVVKVE